MGFAVYPYCQRHEPRLCMVPPGGLSKSNCTGHWRSCRVCWCWTRWLHKIPLFEFRRHPTPRPEIERLSGRLYRPRSEGIATSRTAASWNSGSGPARSQAPVSRKGMRRSHRMGNCFIGNQPYFSDKSLGSSIRKMRIEMKPKPRGRLRGKLNSRAPNEV